MIQSMERFLFLAPPLAFSNLTLPDALWLVPYGAEAPWNGRSSFRGEPSSRTTSCLQVVARELVRASGFEPEASCAQGSCKKSILLVRLALFYVMAHGFGPNLAVVGPKLDPSWTQVGPAEFFCAIRQTVGRRVQNGRPVSSLGPNQASSARSSKGQSQESNRPRHTVHSSPSQPGTWNSPLRTLQS